jgi:hypothetical protein
VAVNRHRLGRAGLAVTELSLGGSPIGNLYASLDDETAAATVDTAWRSGIRFFDTAPHYGLGLSQRRLGAALAGRPRGEFAVSTKVGRLLAPNTHASGSDLAAGFDVPDDLTSLFDFSRDGVLRSLEAHGHLRGQRQVARGRAGVDGVVAGRRCPGLRRRVPMREGLCVELHDHMPVLAGPQRHLDEAFQAPGRVGAVRATDIHLHHLGAGALPGIRHLDADRGPVYGQVIEAERRVGEAVAEREQRLDAARVVVPISDVESLGACASRCKT